MKNAFLILAAVLLAAVALGLAACSDPCGSACERHNACAGAFHQQCAAVCNASVTEAAAVGCGAQYNALESCIADPPPPATVCTDDPGTRCGHEQGLYDACRQTYCMAHADEPACRNPPTP